MHAEPGAYTERRSLPAPSSPHLAPPEHISSCYALLTTSPYTSPPHPPQPSATHANAFITSGEPYDMLMLGWGSSISNPLDQGAPLRPLPLRPN